MRILSLNASMSRTNFASYVALVSCSILALNCSTEIVSAVVAIVVEPLSFEISTRFSYTPHLFPSPLLKFGVRYGHPPLAAAVPELPNLQIHLQSHLA